MTVLLVACLATFCWNLDILCLVMGTEVNRSLRVYINLARNWAVFNVFYTCYMEKAMAPHSSTLAWQIPWMEEPGGLQSMGSLRVGHDWATWLSLFTFLHWRRKWQPTPVFLPGESQGRGAWWAAVSGVAQSWTRLSDSAAAAADML